MNDLRMPDVNNVIIAGNLTRDPVFRRTTNGTPVTNFWIASNRRFKDNYGQWRESVCYVGVVAWYKLAEICSENLQKGSAIIIEGELQSRSLRSEEGRSRNIVEIKARRVQFLNKKEDGVEDEPFQNESMADGTGEQNDPQSSAASGDEEEAHDSPESDSGEENPLKGTFDFGYQDLQMS